MISCFLMKRRRPRETRTDTLMTYTTLFRSPTERRGERNRDETEGRKPPRHDRVHVVGQRIEPRGPRRCDEPDDHRVEPIERSEEHTSELQSLMRISYSVFCLTN